MDVLPLPHRLGTGRARRLNLSKLRHIGIAENEADVRMCNQAAIRIDHIGLSVFADLDLRDHVPDQLQIDLGDADAGIEPGAGERQGHVGLGLPSEINRAEINLLGYRLGELGVM